MKFSNKHTFSLMTFLFLALSLVPNAAYDRSDQNVSSALYDDSGNTILAYVDHTPIWVDGNDDFITQASSEGWDGDGTELNPFIITGYHILTHVTQPFRIWNTDFYWEIRGNNVTTEKTNFCGTWIQNISHGLIADNIFDGLHSGMVFMEVEDLTIENNMISDTTSHGIEVISWARNCTIRNNIVHTIAGAGIIIPNADDVLIHNNTVTNTGGHGIFIRDGENNIIQENDISETTTHGIKLDRGCSNITVRNNDIRDVSDGINCIGDLNEIYHNTIRDCSGTGIKLDSNEVTSSYSTDNQFYDNTVINCAEYSVEIDGYCTDNTFTENDFFECASPIHVNDNGEDNTFSENFYDTWTSPDSDSDGYVDNPYLMEGDAENQDILPLVEPCNPLPNDYVYTPSGTTDTSTTEPPPSSSDIDVVPVAIIGGLAVAIVAIVVTRMKVK